MNEIEAIKIIEKDRDTKCGTLDALPVNARNNAVELNNMIDAEVLAVIAMEKQVAKKPIHVRYRARSTGRMVHFIYCGVCGPYQQRVSMSDAYCRLCGTKIDWTVEE